MKAVGEILLPSKSTSKPKHSPLAEAIVEGLEAYAAHKRGEIKLRTVRDFVPEGVDVRALREKLALSQVQFAATYGFSARTVQEWEQGRSKPDTSANIPSGSFPEQFVYGAAADLIRTRLPALHRDGTCLPSRFGQPSLFAPRRSER